MNNNDVKRILYCMPQTAGDVFLSTGVIDCIQDKFPNAKIYFATEPEYFNILEGNEKIAGVVEFDESMLNYREFETWGPQKNLFDIVFCPFIVTQRIPHWIHGGYGEFLGETYANLCGVPFGELFINIDNKLDQFNLPKVFMTVHSQTRQDPKDYDHIQLVINCIKDIPIVQIGGPNDKKLDNVAIDLRGKTNPQQLAGVLFKARIHLGHDSFPMHIAAHVGCPSVILFGGTYAKQGLNPRRLGLTHAIETEDRGFCVTSCHLIDCEAKKAGFEKCINNIPVRKVLEEVKSLLGEQYVSMPSRPKVSAYMIIKDGIKYGFPFEKCIEYASRVADEVVVVDGGSTDNTFENLKMASVLNTKLKLFQHPWDMTNPTLFGDEKTYARQQCTGDWLIQLDADEVLQEPYPGAIVDLIEKNPTAKVLDLPCINFYGDTETIRIEDNCWKWRISRNEKNIIHGVHGKARQLDPETLRITMDKKVSDGCEYINADTLNIVHHKAAFNPLLLVLHEAMKQKKVAPEKYLEMIQKVIRECPVVFHYSWLDLNRKIQGGEFWDQTFHGKNNATHNTTKDVSERVESKKDNLLKINFNHPLKVK